ncbi:hypothetical protein HK104_010194 [Borealophlyctis nickersoniae]|nr:hypothetical protein HK104_010194 [Borealophlyctis nickersoniae]
MDLKRAFIAVGMWQLKLRFNQVRKKLLLDPLWSEVRRLKPYAVAGESQWYDYALSKPLSAQSAERLVRSIKPQFMGVEMRKREDADELLKFHDMMAPALWDTEAIRN